MTPFDRVIYTVFPRFFIGASKVASLQLVLSLKPQQSSYPELQQALQQALSQEQSNLMWDEQKGDSPDHLLGPLRQRADTFKCISVR